MKRCPICGRIFDDREDFCHQDGTPLTAHSATSAARPQANAKWVAPVIGTLCGLVVVLGFALFWKMGDYGNRNADVRDTANSSAAISNPTPGAVPAQDPGTVTVNTPGDGFLALKALPSIGSARLVKIPHQSKLVLTNCLDQPQFMEGRRGRWCQTEYEGFKGWVFDAFVIR